MLSQILISALLAASTFAHVHHPRGGVGETPKLVNKDPETAASNASFSASKFLDVQTVLAGNAEFVKTRDAAKIQTLVDDGQKPPFMMFACSDSRAPEATIFNSEPGTFFMQRNIANQYKPGDTNAQSVVAYGITVLGVQHVVVLGHYGCGGVAAAIASAPKTKVDVATNIVQTWIGDIRTLYLTTNRTEVVDMRTKNLAIEAEGGVVEEPDVSDPGFRALVEENVKQQVQRISASAVISNLHDKLAAGPAVEKREEGAATIPVFVHGWVHDIEAGTVVDLNISTGPPGFEDFTPSLTAETPEGKPEEEEAIAADEPSAEEIAPTTEEETIAIDESVASTEKVAVPEASTKQQVTEFHDVKSHGVVNIPARLARLGRGIKQSKRSSTRDRSARAKRSPKWARDS